ncbi:hypothetical protein CNMCM5793_009191 [Aspergillus hiratsukae]|uniref:Uncharacterized protein n=1 Tax=Aspergillus hiratsukae TaxID=1194566 RepID=A0A8H6UBF9_9EURO|nr:hypothetical protein CNMCM5793_009191 [Aspergillus hiratsukae]KAF7155664.1 hypothetical protein CNMCM6106_005946 [Aspergillus hiratsukae]
MPKDKPLSRQGSYIPHLQTLPTLSNTSKHTLLNTIATDITATFICISKHLETGTLRNEHTAPIDRIIDIIQGTEVSHRRMLERKVKRYARLARRLKREREWMRREFGEVVKRAEAVNGRWRERVRDLEVVNQAMRKLVKAGPGSETSQDGNGMDKGRQRRPRMRSV